MQTGHFHKKKRRLPIWQVILIGIAVTIIVLFLILLLTLPRHPAEQPSPTLPTATEAPTTEPPTTEPPTTEPPETEVQRARREFYETFPQLDEASTDAYLSEHRYLLKNGFENLYINETERTSDGTSIVTKQGEHVIGIDMRNGILLLRVKGDTYRGVLAICKQPSRLSLRMSNGLGAYGENAGKIAERYGGVLAITASGFIDPEGTGNGGILAGFCRSDGTDYGKHYNSNYDRVELTGDNRLRIVDAPTECGSDVTDAVEFIPALIVDGEIVVDDTCGWTGYQPRCCIGQTETGELLMMVIEGRLTSSRGCSVVVCADILKRYDAYNAMNMDGGTSAIFYYDGAYLTQCDNPTLSRGRGLPNVWVYTGQRTEKP